MKLLGLPVGTKLMWDAPEPFDGYAKSRYNSDDHRVMYPCVIADITPSNPVLGVLVNHNSHKGNWMGRDDVNFLRLPTEQELATITWFELPEKVCVK